jgi:predicted HTH domain antitoxin
MPTQYQITLPDFVHVNQNELLFLLAVTLYSQGRVSLGQGAEMAGVSKRNFLDCLGGYGISAFNHPHEELERDLSNACYSGRRRIFHPTARLRMRAFGKSPHFHAQGREP